MSASCSIYNSSGGTKVTRTIFLFFGNFQNWVYQKGHVFFSHLIGNWGDQALDVLLSFCAKLPKRLIVWETKLYFMTLYTVLWCPLHFRPITSLRMHSGKITWYLLFSTYIAFQLTMGGFICTFALLISLSITLQSSGIGSQSAQNILIWCVLGLTLIKCVISMLFNPAETLHSSAKF